MVQLIKLSGFNPQSKVDNNLTIYISLLRFFFNLEIEEQPV